MHLISFLFVDCLDPTGAFRGNIDLFGLYLSLQIGRLAVAKEVDENRITAAKTAMVTKDPVIFFFFIE